MTKTTVLLFRLLGLGVVIGLAYMTAFVWRPDAPSPAAPGPGSEAPGSEQEPDLEPRVEEQKAAPSPPIIDSPPPTPDRRSEPIGFDDLRELLTGTAGWDLIDDDLLERTLEEQGRTADLLAAAAVLEDDPERALAYLHEALELDPTSPGILSAHLTTLAALERFDEDFALSLEALREVDPKNSLADYYESLVRFKDGDRDAAIHALQAAAAKNHLTNYAQTHTPAIEEFYRAANCSDSVARVMATFDMQAGHLLHLRELNRFVASEIDQEWRAGHHDSAMALARDGARLGSMLTSSDRFLVHELVGISCERQILDAELALQTNAGNTSEIERIGRAITAQEARRERIRALARVLPEVALGLPEERLLRYLDQVVRVGEDTAAMSLPEVRARLLEVLGDDQ